MDIRKPISTNGGDWLTRYGDNWKGQIERLQQKFGTSIEKVMMPGTDATDVPVVYVKKEALLDLLAFMKSEAGLEYDFLSDITATDEESEFRFEVVYQLFSSNRHWRIRVKTRVRENEEVSSIVKLWPGANWAEREVYDMFGIKFSGHPDLRRILMDVRWEGHPLRKDYPLRGYQVFTTPEPANTDLLS